MKSLLQYAKAISARLVAAALIIGAAACSATAWGGSPEFWFLALGAAAVDMTSPFLWSVGVSSNASARAARIACYVAICLSSSSIWIVLADYTAKPLVRSEVAGAIAEDAGADLKLIRAQIAARPAEAARLALFTSEARKAFSAAKIAAVAKLAAVAEAAEKRGAAEACDGGRFQPNDRNPLCKQRTGDHARAVAEARAARQARVAAAKSLSRAQEAESAARAAHARREAALGAATKRRDSGAQDSVGGVYVFRWLANRVGVSPETVAVQVAALFAVALSMMATVAPANLLAAAPMPSQRSRARPKTSQASDQMHSAAAVRHHTNPERKAEIVAAALKMASKGVSVRKMSDDLNVPRATLGRWLRGAKAAPHLTVVSSQK
ncbi:MAG: hypothetical protein MRY74_14515 [Neomegalonema sp.]|nr:hypothetical protein [Neomegalonema sp.]